MSVRIGCSGFYYKDWVGVFYPSGMDRGDYISYYERFFDVLEINYTFYKLPHQYTLKSFLEKTKRLKFSIKAFKGFTHAREYDKDTLRKFLSAMEPLLEEESRFIALLFQFPQSFRYSLESMEYLKKISKDFAGIERVVEFRHRSFQRNDVYEELEELGFSLVNVDAPKIRGLFVGPWVSVGNVNYVRIHGRNSEKWHHHEQAYERYDYLYSMEELKELKEKIGRMQEGKDTYVFFNNHYRGKGALNALQLKELFGYNVDIPRGLFRTHQVKLWE